ncbi:hypothetical protein CFP56_018610 [Quercus suber]|uniref:Uncharacterized protein n=1 Tax=Quercus suber TaxID=58331 RepID=A0AAW0M0Z1_QUESU
MTMNAHGIFRVRTYACPVASSSVSRTHTPNSLLGIHIWSQPKMHSFGIGNSLNQLSEECKIELPLGLLKSLVSSVSKDELHLLIPTLWTRRELF